ncbi:MAG: FHA domain-containing protein [Anaerolineales bacterium]|nr:FHA domain-containing protein [Anaerolineales bacterium]
MPGPNFRLILRRGPTPGQAYGLDQLPITLGRDPSNQLAIEGAGVSRRHAQINLSGSGLVIEDLGSSNGTYVNGERITAPRALQAGDRLSLGQNIEFEVEGPPARPGATVFEGAAMAPPTASAPHAPPPTAAPARPPAPAPQPGAPSPTLMGDISDISLMGGGQRSAPPAQLVIEQSGSPTRTIDLTQPSYSLGRADGNEIQISSPIVSRQHARLERTPEGYSLTPLPQASNPIFFEGRPLPGPRLLQHGDLFRFGSQDPGTIVTLRYSAPAAARASAIVPIKFDDRNVLQLGRDPSNDIRLDAPQISRFHTQIERVGTRIRVRDLRSSNGTFVNGQRIEGEVWIQPKDQVRVGPYRFVLGEDGLDQYDETRGLRVDVVGLNKWVRKDLNILQNISFSIQPREFIVVVGQSGGGKSTLVDSIAGYRPATHGRVYVNGIDVYRHFDAIRYDIGFVPQRDIIHMELTVFQALDYAAQLRMPPDTTREERHRRVMEVLDDLDLAHRKDVQISGLSGGQQKRVSIGVELLTKPGLFFLDEPTSGLDPGTETALMQLMRRLADQGRTIILITHATKNVMLADKVVFLARGGYLAWYGPPDEALKYFDQYRSERDRRADEMEFDQIYAILDNPANGSPAEWAQRYQQHAAYQQYVAQPLAAAGHAVGQAPAAEAAAQAQSAAQRPRQVSQLRQFFILSTRNVNILVRDRFTLFLMLFVPPLVGLLDVVLAFLLGRNPFTTGPLGNVPNVMITLFLLALYGVLVGGVGQMREIVKEQDIYKRERLVNLKILPYVLSKIWVAALLALYQTAAFVIIHYLAFQMPGTLLDAGLVYITLTLSTMAGMMLGLFASALAPNPNSASLLVIVMMIPQIVLGGALIALPGSGQYVSALTTTRWAFEALMSITAVGSDVAGDACWALPDPLRDLMTLEDKADQGCRCLGTAIFSSCNFPGVGRFYDPKIDEPAPTQPDGPPDGPPGEPPVEPAQPELPPQPVEPENQADQIAMADYFAALRAWQADVDQIQADYEAELADYRAQVQVYQDGVADYQADLQAYQDAMIDYQQRLAAWQVARASAVEPAEGLIYQVNRDFGWTFVDKHDPTRYYPKIVGTWIAQLVYSGVLFLVILVLQKRKDVV